MASSKNRNRKERKVNASKLLEQSSKRSPADQIAILDVRLGKGVGAKRERERLAKKVK